MQDQPRISIRREDDARAAQLRHEFKSKSDDNMPVHTISFENCSLVHHNNWMMIVGQEFSAECGRVFTAIEHFIVNKPNIPVAEFESMLISYTKNTFKTICRDNGVVGLVEQELPNNLYKPLSTLLRSLEQDKEIEFSHECPELLAVLLLVACHAASHSGPQVPFPKPSEAKDQNTGNPKHVADEIKLAKGNPGITSDLNIGHVCQLILEDMKKRFTTGGTDGVIEHLKSLFAENFLRRIEDTFP